MDFLGSGIVLPLYLLVLVISNKLQNDEGCLLASPDASSDLLLKSTNKKLKDNWCLVGYFFDTLTIFCRSGSLVGPTWLRVFIL